jgi:signal transduction histidine kinase/CheY-like chemotaxis protein
MQIEQRFFRKDDTEWWAHLSVSAVRCENGNLSYFIAQAIDITQQREADAAQRKLDEHLRQIQKLESLGVMAGGIAHDFNNLLTSVIGYAELLRNELEPGSRSHDRANQIDKAARRGAALTHQMLAYAGGGRYVVQPLQLSEVVGGMKALLESAASGHIAVRYDLVDGAPPVEADESQMRQLAINLVTNAAEALGEGGGTIEIRTGVVDQASTEPQGYVGDELHKGRHVYLEVRDTGSGIQAELVPRIFEPFFTTKFQGRGLGLSAALGIARGHQGGIAVSTEVGRGTTVRVLLPCASPMASDTTPASDAAALHDRPATVLIADDEDVVRDVATAALEQAGFNVTTAADGHQALDIVQARAYQISLVLLNQMMPELSGTEVARELRRHWPDLPIVLTSGHSAVRAMEGLPDGVVDAFLQKPFEANQLVALVRRVVGDTVRHSPDTEPDTSRAEVTQS